MKRYVLDACAVIALLNNEPGALVVVELLQDKDADIVMHKLNLLEVYYDVLRQCGVDTAESVLRETSVSSIWTVLSRTFFGAGKFRRLA